MDIVEIGKRIQFIRKNKLKLSRADFADLLNTNLSSIGKLERGEFKTIDLSLLDKISKVCNCTLDEIVDGELDDRDYTIKKINYLLRVLDKEELIYHFNNIQNVTRLLHLNQGRTLKNIKNNPN